ncbi:VOC family protein [Streptomyces sp. NPDC059009]|uniref:VOC family protein n=1 Tax=Streptomyces sp. NPDC059009 TaxID=3346694 RepID=UPI003683E599
MDGEHAMSRGIRWVYAFVDRPVAGFARAVDFWSAVTDTERSELRGEWGQFTTLLPHAAGADAFVKAQAVEGAGGAHLDFAVDDVAAAARRARELGATPVFAEEGLEVLRSPAGHGFCLVPWESEKTRPAPVTGPAGDRSRLDQVCVDAAPSRFEAEVSFWSAFTGWESVPGSRPEFHVVRSPAELPVQILVQRLEEEGPVNAHVDVACSDREACRRWHEELGASSVAEGAHWIVMRDPAGGVYCLTGRQPDSGQRGNVSPSGA